MRNTWLARCSGISCDNNIWTPIPSTGLQPIPKAGSDVGPSLASFHGTLYMAWKGSGGDKSIWYSSCDSGCDSNSSTTPQRVPGANTDFAPSLKVLGDKLIMAWKGANGDQGIYVNSYVDRLSSSNPGWTLPSVVPGIGTSIGPDLATYNGKLFMAWKGSINAQGVNDQRIFYSTSPDGVSWAPQRFTGASSQFGPSIESYNGKLYMAFKGASPNPGIFVNSCSGNGCDTNTWTTPILITDANTNWRPSLEQYQGVSASGQPELHLGMAWKNAFDLQIYFNHCSGNGCDINTWTTPKIIPGINTEFGPSLAFVPPFVV